MRTKKKTYDLPLEAWNNFKIKQEKLSNAYFKITGKKKIIPLTKVITESSKVPLWLDNKEVVQLHKKKNKI